IGAGRRQTHAGARAAATTSLPARALRIVLATGKYDEIAGLRAIRAEASPRIGQAQRARAGRLGAELTGGPQQPRQRALECEAPVLQPHGYHARPVNGRLQQPAWTRPAHRSQRGQVARIDHDGAGQRVADRLRIDARTTALRIPVGGRAAWALNADVA